jgi:sugar/nucleoside kinase (ribokinase family)
LNDVSTEKSKPAPSVAVVGSAAMDRVVFGRRVTEKIGGTVVYAGFTFQRHGIDTAVLTNVAARDLKHFGNFEASGVRLLAGPTGVTTRFVNRESDGNRVQEMPAAAEPILCRELLADLHSVRHVHLGPLHPDDIHADLLTFLKRGRYFVSTDLQGYVRRIRDGRVVQEASEKLEEVLAISDAVKAADEELRIVLEWFGEDARTLQLHFGFEELLVTSGGKGGYLINGSGERIEYESVPVERVHDPTGAGDVFFAAYLAGRYHENWSERESLAHAARVAARHVEGKYIPRSVLEI